MNSETDLQRRIQLAVSMPNVRMFRNTVGHGWSGDLIRKFGNAVTLANARPVTYGLCPGSSDLIGLKSVTITPDMVGQRVAVFSALEVKTETGRTAPEQLAFIETIILLGGLAGVVRSERDALDVLGVDKANTGA